MFPFIENKNWAGNRNPPSKKIARENFAPKALRARYGAAAALTALSVDDILIANRNRFFHKRREDRDGMKIYFNDNATTPVAPGSPGRHAAVFQRRIRQCQLDSYVRAARARSCGTGARVGGCAAGGSSRGNHVFERRHRVEQSCRFSASLARLPATANM